MININDFISILVKQFGFKLRYVRKLKYMYICNTDNGLKLLKPLNCPLENIIFVNNIKNHLIQKDFNKIDSYYIAENGLPYVISDSTPYVLTDYIDYKELDLSDQQSVTDGIKNIANFHKLAQGYNITSNNASTNTSINVSETFEKKLATLKQMKKKVSKQKSLVDFEVVFIKNYEYFYKNAVEAIEIINKYNINSLDTKANKNNMICHNKLKEDNILVNNNQIYLTNFEDIGTRHYIYDLASFINRYIRKQSVNCINMEDIIRVYNKINYIDKNNIPILYALIKFPDRYIDNCENFFQRRRNFTPICIINQIENIVELKDFQEEYIKNIKKY